MHPVIIQSWLNRCSIGALAAIVFWACLTLKNAQCDDQITVQSISPAAEDITDEVPNLGGRITAFAWIGDEATSYTVKISIDTEPALVVGVGAVITNTSFDAQSKILTVQAEYNGDRITADDAVLLSENTFIIALDSGVPSGGERVSVTSSECYGPGSNPKIFRETQNDDFGEDDGLVDRPSSGNKNEPDQNLGFPQQARGTFASTNSFYWCAVPPIQGGIDVGLKVLAFKNSVDHSEFYLSSNYIDYLNQKAVKKISPSTLAIFTQGVQVSPFVTQRSGGALAEVELEFVEGSTSITGSDESPPLTPSSTELVSRTFTLNPQETVSIIPETTEPTSFEITFSGFVADPDSIGRIIEVVRFDRASPPLANFHTSFASSGVVVARDIVASNGSYSSKVPSSAIFPNNASRSDIASRVIGKEVQSSRQISLTNRTRDNRR